MKMPNLSDLFMSISDFKKELSEIINKGKTKIILKNNDPVSVVMPYEDYVALTESAEEAKKRLVGVGQDFTFANGVQMMVVAETNVGPERAFADSVAIKAYIKMKTSGDYKLHYTLQLGSPNEEEALTIDEVIQRYKNL